MCLYTKFIENPVRKEMGLYLGRIMNDKDYVGLEPAGYVSYYSRKALYDYPGLVNKKVVHYLKENRGTGLCNTLKHFRPEYIVLRHYECLGSDSIRNEYSLLKDFRADKRIGSIKGIAHNIDIHFQVFKRND